MCNNSFISVLFLVTLSLARSVSSAYAADLNSVDLRGRVARVDVYALSSGPDNVHVFVYADPGSPAIPAQIETQCAPDTFTWCVDVATSLMPYGPLQTTTILDPNRLDGTITIYTYQDPNLGGGCFRAQGWIYNSQKFGRIPVTHYSSSLSCTISK